MLQYKFEIHCWNDFCGTCCAECTAAPESGDISDLWTVLSRLSVRNQ